MDQVYTSFMKLVIYGYGIYWIIKMLLSQRKKDNLTLAVIVLTLITLLLSYKIYKIFLISAIFILILFQKFYFKGKQLFISQNRIDALLNSIVVGYLLFMISHLISVIIYSLIRDHLYYIFWVWIIFLLFISLGGVLAEFFNKNHNKYHKWEYSLIFTFLIWIINVYRIREMGKYKSVYFRYEYFLLNIITLFILSLIGCKIGEKIKKCKEFSN